MRSYLFVPGDSVRKFEKARQIGSDALIIDLEDSVGSERKSAARTVSRDMLLADRRDQRLYVRINPPNTGLSLADLAAVVPVRPDGFVLPKCEGADHLKQLSLWLDGPRTRQALTWDRRAIDFLTVSVA